MKTPDSFEQLKRDGWNLISSPLFLLMAITVAGLISGCGKKAEPPAVPVSNQAEPPARSQSVAPAPASAPAAPQQPAPVNPSRPMTVPAGSSKPVPVVP